MSATPTASQPPGIGVSSTASTVQGQAVVANVKSKDPGWKYCTCTDENKRNSLKCTFCHNVYTNGITRIKHQCCGGKCLSVEYTDKVGEVAKTHGLKLHIDGARIFNASAALGVPVDRLVRAADSVSVGLAKGIGAPVGSVIVGSKAFIHKATILRKTLGGGIRQVGILCAAAEVAVRDTVGKLADDHRKAKVLADGLKKIEQFTVDLASVETNLVFFDMVDARISPAKLCRVLEQRNVLATPIGSKSVRLAVHYQISDGDVQYTLTCIEEAVEEILTGDAKLEHLTNGFTTNS